MVCDDVVFRNYRFLIILLIFSPILQTSDKESAAENVCSKHKITNPMHKCRKENLTNPKY